jgi:tripartite-type tricarboxylate transporter receptor subunit TctC
VRVDHVPYYYRAGAFYRAWRGFVKSPLNAFALVLFAVAHGIADAQNYPNRTIRIVLPYPPGGGTDVVARVLAQKLIENLGQQVFVDNRGGASGNIGMELVAKSAPDGYTLGLALTAQFAVNPSLYAKLPYNPVKDYAPVTLLAMAPYVLLTHPSLPAKTVKDLVALANAKPGQITVASAGNGSGAHLALELMKSMAHVDMVHIPYKGAGPALPDMISGQVQSGFTTWASCSPHVKTGRLRALGVTTLKRSPAIPDLPAIAETLSGYDSPVWYGVVVPAATPPEIVTRLNQEILRALRTPEFRERLVADAIEPIGTTPEQFGDYIRSEQAKWSKVVNEARVKVD